MPRFFGLISGNLLKQVCLHKKSNNEFGNKKSLQLWIQNFTTFSSQPYVRNSSSKSQCPDVMKSEPSEVKFASLNFSTPFRFPHYQRNSTKNFSCSKSRLHWGQGPSHEFSDFSLSHRENYFQFCQSFKSLVW